MRYFFGGSIMSQANGCPSLRGKTVAVYTRNRSSKPVILSECFFESRENRLFLVGTEVPADQASLEWTDGVRHAVAWDAVDEYLVFASPDDYYARAQVVTAATIPQAAPATQPMFAYPQSSAGFPVEPSGVHLDPETPLDIGAIVLAYSQGRWWRAEVVALDGEDTVTIHYPGWDSTWDVTVPKTELQVDLSGSIESDS
jgi:hypothetical protein